MAIARLLSLLAALMFAASLNACSDAKLGIDPERRIIDIGNVAEPLSLDPAKTSGNWENNIIGNMFIGLTTEDEHSNIIPGMAERWEVSDDGLTWTFFLRKAKWSDGVPVTAYDFEFAWRRVMDPKTIAEYAAILYPIKNAEAVKSGKLPVTALGVRAIDEQTLEVKLEHPTAYLLGIMKHQTAFPAPKHVVQQWGDDWIKPAHVVVNGPYTLVKWWSNYLVHLRKNPMFYDAAHVCLNDLYFYPISDLDTAVRKVETGELAWNTGFSGSKYDEIKQRLPNYVHVAPYMATTYLSINLTLPKFQNPGVRRALSEAIDREFLATKIIKGGTQPSYRFVPPGMPGYPGGARLDFADEPVALRRAEARKLLAAAGYGPNNPFKFIFSFRSGSSRMAVVLQADWRSIAPWVEVELRPTETQIHYANLRAKNFEIGDGGWIGDYADAQTFLYLLESRTKDQNYPGYSNPQYDALMARSYLEVDPVARGKIMAEAEQIMLDDNPVIPLTVDTSRNLLNPRITGFADNIEDIHRARYMCIRGLRTESTADAAANGSSAVPRAH
jgi:oligopeptide transport system substrate-binding protein